MTEQPTRKNIAPAITLMFLAPMLTEVLPGATRFSSIFVLPIEMLVWGGGALLIRFVCRKYQLGWLNMLLLAFCLSMAEEFLIQQTSIAPMVIQLKGVTYARAFGINYVYLLWALIYEPVFVVLLPVYLTELIYPERANDLWISKKGVVLVSILFVLGGFLAWFSWTQIARPKVFHVPAYHPALPLVLLAIVVIAVLVFIATGPSRNKLSYNTISWIPPQPWIAGLVGALWAVILYGIVVLAFGSTPSFSPIFAMIIGLVLAAAPFYIIPNWTASTTWSRMHTYALIFGTMIGSMAVSFIGFWGEMDKDLYFKIIVNIIAVILMIILGNHMKKSLTMLRS